MQCWRVWREGQNVEYRVAYADGKVVRLDPLAMELVGKGVEVIVVGGTTVALAAQRATRSISIVMANDELIAISRNNSQSARLQKRAA